MRASALIMGYGDTVVSRRSMFRGYMVSRKFSAKASSGAGHPGSWKCEWFQRSLADSGNAYQTSCPNSWQRMSRNKVQSSPHPYETCCSPGRLLSNAARMMIFPGSLRLISLSNNPLWVGGYGDLNLMSTVGDVYLFSGGSSKTLYLGYSSYPFGRISLNGSVTVEVGSAPKQGAASGLNSGSLRLATGGSLWLVDGSGNWDRVRTYNYNP